MLGRTRVRYLEETVTCMDDDPLLGLGLKPVTLADQDLFNARFPALSEPLSDYTFSQVYTWGNSLRICWKEIRGHLCVFANGTGDLTLFMPPIGDGDTNAALAEAFEVMDAYNAAHGVPHLSRAEYVSDEILSRLDQSKLVVKPMAQDYLYDSQRMIDLAGGDLASKRQLKNRFMRNYECRVEIFDRDAHRDGCFELLQLWKDIQDANHACDRAINAIKRLKESRACELALESAAELGMKGLVVYVKNKPGSDYALPQYEDWSLRGFTLGQAIGRDQSVIAIEKTDLNVKGLAQFIFSEFCRTFWADRRYVNVGDDWGLETLAWTKMSYRPVKLLQKYELRLARPVAVQIPAVEPVVEELGTEVLAQATARSAGILPIPMPLPMPEPAASAAQPSEELIVRPARKGDLDSAVELERTCFSAYCLSKRQLQYLQNRPSAVFLVAEHAGRIVGEGICLVRKHKRSVSGRIYSLAVSSDYRGRKLGQRLLQSMVDGLAARGVKRIYLEVEESNTGAIGLYERFGFTTVEHLPDYYGEGKPGLHMLYEVPAAVTA